MQITNLLNQPFEVAHFVNNVIAGGVIDAGATGASQATGGFAVATSSNNGRMTCTWAAGFTTNPIIIAHPIAAASSDTLQTFVYPFGIGLTSCGFNWMRDSGAASAQATISVGTANVFLFGFNTGTRIS